MKKALWILAIGWGIVSIPQARADFEFVETSLTFLEDVQAKKQTIEQKLQTIESTYNSARQGDIGALTGVAESSGLNFDAVSVTEPKSLAAALGDKRKLSDAVQSTMPQNAETNQIEAAQANKDLNDEMLRGYLTRMYAYAFTLRTNMAKENKDAKPEESTGDAKDSREMIKKATKEATEASRRLNRINDMQASAKEFVLRLMARNMQPPKEDE
ncbi:MAG: hypothetical protein IJ689_01425 [Alphaproteobacteria bacterium]|nr:hypothetical protein [Alphaproteobacteria bacterium]